MNEIAKMYLRKLQDQYLLSKRAKHSRYSMEWGEWSRNFNLDIRALIDNNHKQSKALKAIFVIWINYSELLEIYYKYGHAPYTKAGKKREIAKILKDQIHFINHGQYKGQSKHTIDETAKLFKLGKK